MHSIIRRTGLVLGATTTAIALTAGSAMAHECYIANQSATGAQAAGEHSEKWFAVDLVEEFLGSAADDEVVACFTASLEAAGYATTLAIMDGPVSHGGVLGSRNPHVAEKSADGKGIDHAFSGGQVLEIATMAEECMDPGSAS